MSFATVWPDGRGTSDTERKWTMEEVQSDKKAQEVDPKPRCDHICLLDADHVRRGEPHFYGYEFPPPRGRTGRVLLHALVRLARWAKP